ncbi:hypothetical protein T01_3552 [Trichinella spiralis]|uniref:Uncharacterized protein n=1 Tax=Trichinella spiralis TaxID=6334 RepID=A0A0V1B0U1_TRISP|nr:hypothetical protein T01_3552 [Trichinella spiralis]
MHGCGARYLEELKKSLGKEWQPVNGYGYWENRAWLRFAYIISQLRNGLKFSSRKTCVYSSKHKTTSRHVFIVRPVRLCGEPIPSREFHQGPPMPMKIRKSKNGSIAIFESVSRFHGHFKAAFQSLRLIINHPDLLRSKADANSLASSAS